MRIFLQISLIQYILLGGQNFSTWGTKFLHLGDKISPLGGQNFSTFGGRNFSIWRTKFLHLEDEISPFLEDEISPFLEDEISPFGGQNFSIWRTKFLHLEDKNFFPLGSCKKQKQWFTIFVATVFWMDYFFLGSLISIWLAVKL